MLTSCEKRLLYGNFPVYPLYLTKFSNMKFIGTIDPPKEHPLGGDIFPYWGVFYSEDHYKYWAGPITGHFQDIYEGLYSEPHESLASFMYLVHGEGTKMPPKKALIITISYREALKRIIERKDTRVSEIMLEACKKALEAPSPLNEEESVYV